MSEFSEAQRKELEGLVNSAINSAIQFIARSSNAYTDSRIEAAIERERKRLAHIVETCEPVSDFAADDPAGLKGEIPDLAETLVALGKAIRTGHHDE
jgi:hypothetical protein